MLIHGIERHFALTVGAYFDIAKICPEGDIRNLSDILEGDELKTFEVIMHMAVAMNKGYNTSAKYLGHEAEDDSLTIEELQTLSPFELPELANVIMESFQKGQRTEIELKESKKKETETVSQA